MRRRVSGGLLVVLAVVPATVLGQHRGVAPREGDRVVNRPAGQRRELLSPRRNDASELVKRAAGPAKAAVEEAATEESELPLPPPVSGSRANAESSLPRGSGLAWWTPVGALAVVLALIVVVGRLLRARGNAGDASLPRDVLEVVGSAYLDPKQTLYVVRWGPRLLLVGLGSGGARTLAEVADPAEVERMVELCRQPRPRSVMSAFRKVLGVSPGRGEQ